MEKLSIRLRKNCYSAIIIIIDYIVCGIGMTSVDNERERSFIQNLDALYSLHFVFKTQLLKCVSLSLNL